jgi:hypothetical protein
MCSVPCSKPSTAFGSLCASRAPHLLSEPIYFGINPLWPRSIEESFHSADADHESEMNSSMQPCFVILSAGQGLHNVSLPLEHRPRKQILLDVVKDAQQISPLGESVLSFIVQFVRERGHGHLDCDLSGCPSLSRTSRWLLSCDLPPPHTPS